MANVSKPMPERFWLRVKFTDTCWLWVGAKTGSGYGVITGGYDKVKKKCRAVSAHRYSFMLHKGYLPEEIDHTCFNPACVNPDHLDDVTHDENMKRSDLKRGIRSAKTHCPSGHEYAGSNLFFRKERNRRECRECINKRSRKK